LDQQRKTTNENKGSRPFKYVARLQFKAEFDKCSNNIAEYEAVLLGLCKL
jgi:ribonuclease HI